MAFITNIIVPPANNVVEVMNVIANVLVAVAVPTRKASAAAEAVTAVT